MLKLLSISNYVLIENAEINFEKGFSVITGETGAGKSILLGALHLLSGAKGDIKILRDKEKKCVVEGIFDISDIDLSSFFIHNEIDAHSEICILRREIYPSGITRSFINDTPVKMQLLKSLTEELFDIHSQHQNLLLSHQNFLIENIDAVAGNDILLSEYKTNYNQWKTCLVELEKNRILAKEGAENLDYYLFQYEQIKQANLQTEEIESLEEEYKVLSHIDELKSTLYAAVEILDHDEKSPRNNLRTLIKILEDIVPYSIKIKEMLERLNSVQIELSDIQAEIESLSENNDFDADRFQYVEERLNLIYSLQKKFNVSTVAEIITKGNEIKSQIDKIENLDFKIKQLEKEELSLRLSLQKSGDKLTSSRKQTAQIIEEQLIERLNYLGMPHVKVQFQFAKLKEPEIKGFDQIKLLFSANKQLPMEDTAICASGGEIARMMLSFKNIVAKKRQLPTIIFDEVDTGVSGLMAEKMGQVMVDMSQHVQVICITHLPQIAALGKYHYKVKKIDEEKGTISVIEQLDNKQRIIEIADMLSGIVTTDAAIENAKKLLKIK